MKQSSWINLALALAMAVTGAACAETDAGITTKVKAKLAADDTVKAYQIDVDTRDKVVTLKGFVENEAARTQAVRLARETEGVANVIDSVVVSPQNTGVPTGDVARTAGDAAAAGADAAITAAVKAKLLADPDTSGLKIDVDTTDAVVTLTGTVKTAAEKTEAVKLAGETTGVKSVTDRLTVGS
jgi:hyperosmotically inducible protein